MAYTPKTQSSMFDSREVENRKRIQAENRIAVNKYRDEFPTLTDEQLDAWMEQKKNNFLAAVHFTKHVIGVSFLDISTGEFLVAEGSADYIDKLLQSLKPTEVLFQKGNQEKFYSLFGNDFHPITP